MARIYADENFDYSIMERLRALGHDVLMVREAGERGGDGTRVLARATAEEAEPIPARFEARQDSNRHRDSSRRVFTRSPIADSADRLVMLEKARAGLLVAALLVSCF